MRDMIRLGQVEPVRKQVADATQLLLGDTIVLTEAEWREPTILPGWTRAMVATHLARGADAMRETILAVVDGRPDAGYPPPDQRLADLERGAGRSGLDLQIDLDTSAGALGEAFGLVDDWRVPVRLPLGEMPVAAVVVARFHEVVLHHLDLNTGFGLSQLDTVSASWLLQWAALWLRTRPGLPAVELTSESGVREEIGDRAPTRTVTGSDADLWGWLTGRTDGATLNGTAGLVWPLLG
nr:maleylpyruvate isomerase family mycothiol-dependent enzyme [Propionibacterium sp.]